MLAGKLPFEAKTTLEMMLMHVGSTPPCPSEISPNLDPSFDLPLLCMLEKDPCKRPSSLTEALETLSQAALSLGIDPSHESVSISPKLHIALENSPQTKSLSL